MKIKLSELRRIIREEMGNMLKEAGPNKMWPPGKRPPPHSDTPEDLWGAVQDKGKEAKELFTWLKAQGGHTVKLFKDFAKIATLKWPAEEYGYWWRQFFLKRDHLNAKGDFILNQLWTEFTRPDGDVAKFLKGFDPRQELIKNHEEFMKWLRSGEGDKGGLPEWIPSLGAGPLDRGPTTRRRKERAPLDTKKKKVVSPTAPTPQGVDPVLWRRLKDQLKTTR